MPLLLLHQRKTLSDGPEVEVPLAWLQYRRPLLHSQFTLTSRETSMDEQRKYAFLSAATVLASKKLSYDLLCFQIA